MSAYGQAVQTVVALVTLGALASGICLGYAAADLIERLWTERLWTERLWRGL